MRLSKAKSIEHTKALKILEQNILSWDDKLYVLEHYQEGATNMNSLAGAFFTPQGLARDFELSVNGTNIVDMCAGIGTLAFYVYHRGKEYYEAKDKKMCMTCIELNAEYVEAGKKILPEATWIHGDITDINIITQLTGKDFDCVISNPPFGAVKTASDLDLNYLRAEFEYKVVEIASRIAKRGSFILPQESTPYRYSGYVGYSKQKTQKYEIFRKQTGIEFEFNCGIDTHGYYHDWHGVKPRIFKSYQCPAKGTI